MYKKIYSGTLIVLILFIYANLSNPDLGDPLLSLVILEMLIGAFFLFAGVCTVLFQLFNRRGRHLNFYQWIGVMNLSLGVCWLPYAVHDFELHRLLYFLPLPLVGIYILMDAHWLRKKAVMGKVAYKRTV